jgi:hypothetical protein
LNDFVIAKNIVKTTQRFHNFPFTHSNAPLAKFRNDYSG